MLCCFADQDFLNQLYKDKCVPIKLYGLDSEYKYFIDHYSRFLVVKVHFKKCESSNLINSFQVYCKVCIFQSIVFQEKLRKY